LCNLVLLDTARWRRSTAKCRTHHRRSPKRKIGWGPNYNRICKLPIHPETATRSGNVLWWSATQLKRCGVGHPDCTLLVTCCLCSGCPQKNVRQHANIFERGLRRNIQPNASDDQQGLVVHRAVHAEVEYKNATWQSTFAVKILERAGAIVAELARHAKPL
jgi:hypothetical protein